MRKGIYLMGEFTKGRKASYYFDIVKPFEIDKVEGRVEPRVFHFFKRNVWFNEWEFLEGFKMADLKNPSEFLKDYCNETWERWCKKHRRKYIPIFILRKTQESCMSKERNKTRST